MEDVSGLVLEDFQVFRMEYLSPLHNSPPRSVWLGTRWNRKDRTPFTSLSLHLGLHGPLLLFLTLSLHLRLSLLVSGDLQRAMKSTHVSLTGCSIRAELRIIFIHLLLSQTQCGRTSVAVSITPFT